MAQQGAQVLQKLRDRVLANIAFVDHWLLGDLVLLRQELVDAGCCVRLVDDALALEVLREEAHEVQGVLRRYLDSEHVDELHARSFQQRQIIDLLFLQLRQHVSRNVSEQLCLWNCQLPDASPERILRHASSDQQVQ